MRVEQYVHLVPPGMSLSWGEAVPPVWDGVSQFRMRQPANHHRNSTSSTISPHTHTASSMAKQSSFYYCPSYLYQTNAILSDTLLPEPNSKQ